MVEEIEAKEEGQMIFARRKQETLIFHSL